MRAGLDGAFAVVLDFAAPENGLAFFVISLELQPNVERIHCAAGEKVADFARSNDYIYANVIATANRGIGTVDWSRDRAHFTRRTFRQRGLGFFPYGESCGEFLFAQLVAHWCGGFFSCG